MRRKILLVLGVICLLAVGAVVWINKFLLANFISVKNIVCKTQYGPCGQQDVKLASRFVGRNLFLVTSAEVDEILAQNFRNNKVYVNKVFPQTLSLFVEKRKGFVAVGKPSLGNGVFLVDSEGIVLSHEENSALPVIVLSDDVANLVVGEKVSQDLLNAGKTLRLVSLAQKANKAKLSKDALIVDLMWDLNTINVIFPLEGDSKVVVGALQLILTQAKMDGKIPKAIDLQYKNPVLKY
ncbi:MAG: hypothetical protein A2782_00160 [Candidatus Blackburnbacteria bacterium RIFCSPHIGHO2_01_FULL_43_15b]|uniref:POTRA domain-containing protein n=1 Tax=Candidatus Blackburnbacteria bacterium RIFCSPHIGHO2_01_FULL_43_15b TaxID=1797513 RepID=A0A1G1V1M4_9BACT|nr:MAG: hypothetical protein A2782_00160 [Candidatus Blackburnbacteria bacterium RIFCSPHIGHO2_01_FULL_43_15b]